MKPSRAKTPEPRAKELTFSNDIMSIRLADGRTLIVPLAWYPRLRHGSAKERQNYEIIGQGEYIHWPDLDEDLTVIGLLEGRKSAEAGASINKWLAQRKSRSPIKKPRPKKQIRRAS